MLEPLKEGNPLEKGGKEPRKGMLGDYHSVHENLPALFKGLGVVPDRQNDLSVWIAFEDIGVNIAGRVSEEALDKGTKALDNGTKIIFR